MRSFLEELSSAVNADAIKGSMGEVSYLFGVKMGHSAQKKEFASESDR